MPTANPLAGLIDILVDLYVFALMLRFLLQLVRANFYDRFTQFVITVTNPPLAPLRRVIPSLYGQDWASLLFAFLLKIASLTLISALAGLQLDGVIYVVVTLFSLIDTAINVFTISILVQSILSWVNPMAMYEMTIFQSLNEPLLAPVRRLFPPISGFDLSPLIVLIGLWFLGALLQQMLHGLL